MGEPWLVFAFFAGFAAGCELTRRHVRTSGDRDRRIGWGFGYGAGWVDHKHGVYKPTPPDDGRARGESNG